LGVYFGEPGLGVVRVGYGALEWVSRVLKSWRKAEKTYSKYLRFAAALVDMMVVEAGYCGRFDE
jgi:hypothetical protein